jgi:cyanophycin synthetase
MTNTDGVYVDGHCIDTGDCSGPKSAKNVLHHPDVDAAVLETARGGILREGLAFDKCDVAVVTNVGSGDHLGLNYITTVDELAVLKRVIVQNVAASGTAVLNATDPIVAAMSAKSRGAVTFFALDQFHPVMATHRAQGRAVVYVEKGQIVAAKGSEKHYLNLIDIPVTLGGAIGFQVENVMASVAAAWALGVDWNTVRSGLASFSSEQNNAQGRFNVFDYKGATVIADYGHNPDAMAALVQAVQAMPASRRSVVISGPGDRRNDDIRQITQILGDAFEEVVMYEDQCQRGRADGEVMALLREGLANANKATKRSEIYGEFLAIDTALNGLQAGELCLVLVDQVPEAIAHIQSRIKAL